MKITVFLFVVFIVSCAEREPPVERAKKLATHYLDSLYKPHKIALGGFSYFSLRDDGKRKTYSMMCEYWAFSQHHRDMFIFNSSVTKVEHLVMATY